jgi:hypothetical protein
MGVVELFAGIGSQTQALKNIGVDTFNEKYHVFGVVYREEE